MTDDAATDGPDLEARIARSKTLHPGDDHYRAYVGPPDQFDFMGASQFRLLTGLGLREEHRLVDIGCGSLRVGRLLIQYLLPGRYVGVEPNAWLWQQALDEEIGRDVVARKRPVFSDDADFSLAGVADGSVDYIIAQSIYSHCGSGVVHRSMAAAARVLAPGGQFLFTIVAPDCPGYAGMQRGPAAEGWVYPYCVGFTEAEIAEICDACGLHVQQLAWFHPRQRWFRAVPDAGQLLTPGMEKALGSGHPLFDPRFG